MNMGKYAKETRQNNQNSNTGIFVLGFVHFKWVQWIQTETLADDL